MASENQNPFLLAASVPEPDPRLLPLLRSQPALAAEQDAHGYSLLHAAASYNHIGLLRILVEEFHVNINLTDEDGETCLFVSETVEVARCLVEELGIDTGARNDEGVTAVEKIESEEEFPEVAAYLREKSTDDTTVTSRPTTVNGHPPPLPPNMRLNLTTVTDDGDGLASDQEPDPGFRQRIEELAAKDNFSTEEGQQELRELIQDAVRGVSQDEREAQRRRVN